MPGNKLLVFVGLFSCYILFSACTAEEVYNQVQQDHQRQCRMLPISRQEHCLSLNSVSYEEYRRELEELQVSAENPNL